MVFCAGSEERRKQRRAAEGRRSDLTTKTTSSCCSTCTAVIKKPQGSLSAGSNPTTSWLSTPCYHFDFQGVVSGSPGSYVLNIEGSVSPTSCRYRWNLDAAAGTLTGNITATPTHVAPIAAGEGILIFEGTDGTTAICTAKKEVKIYQDHLARDRDNFGVGISCSGTWQFQKYGVSVTMNDTWNCFGSVDHSYNGSGNGYVDSVNIPQGWNTQTYEAPITSSHWNAIRALLTRGDVVSFWSDDGMGGHSAQHAHTCIGGTTMYGANNEPVIQPTGYPATWRWFV